MKKTLAIILACCLITGCGAVPERYDDNDPGGSSDGSYISTPVSSEDNPYGGTMGGSNDPDISDDPQSSVSSSLSSSSKPQSSKPSSSSTSSNKPQSGKPSSSSTSSSKLQSSKPSSSSTSSSKPQSGKPSSSSTSSSKPQSSKPSSSSTSSSKPQSTVSSSTREPSKPEIIGDYGRRAPEAWEIEYADEVFRLVNEERAREGLPEFKKMDKLTESATIRAWETLVEYGHDRPDGQSFYTALKEQGINYQACGENIAAGQKTPQQVVDAWMNSPGHRANILSDKYEYLGVGFYYDYDGTGGSYRYFWAQNFCCLF